MINDLRFAVRSLARRPGLAAAIVLTLAVGLGANTAIGSAVYAYLFAPLPFAAAEDLVVMVETRGGEVRPVALPNFFDWQAQAQSFSEMVAYRGDDAALTGDGEATRIGTSMVSDGFFAALGIEPALGRAFAADENAGAGVRVAILGHGLWQRRYGGDPAVVGRTIQLDAEPYEVVGVLGRDVRLPQAGTPDVWVPLALAGSLLSERGSYSNTHVLGRLTGTASLATARAEMEVVARRLEEAYPGSNTGARVKVTPLREDLTSDLRPALLVLWGAVAFVLLIACVNVANLLLVRTTARRQELAIRASLGAGRFALLRQVLAESLVLAVAGGVLGLVFALWGVDLIRASVSDPTVAAALGFGAPVLAFTVGLVLASALAAGLVPAIAAGRLAPQRALGVRGAVGRERARTQSALVSVQVALALLLAIGAGLMTASVARLARVDPGFDPTGLLTFGVRPPAADYPPGEARAAFYQSLLETLGALPGASAVSLVQPLPLSGSRSASSVEIEGRPAPPPGEPPLSVAYEIISPSYLAVAGIGLLEGRGLSDRDRRGSGAVALVDETMARQVWPGESAVGKRLRTNVGDGPWTTVVGVVRPVRHRRLSEAPEPRFYVPLAQSDPWRSDVVIAVTGATAPRQTAALAGAIRQAVQALDPNLPIDGPEPMAAVIDRQLARSRQPMLLLAAFAAIAVGLAALGVGLAALGVYAVIAHGVAARTRELGVRVALGARRSEIVGAVVGRGLALTAAGLAIGLVAAAALTRSIQALLYGVSATDPRTYLTVAATILAVAAAASYLPARRAAAIDPVRALRHD